MGHFITQVYLNSWFKPNNLQNMLNNILPFSWTSKYKYRNGYLSISGWVGYRNKAYFLSTTVATHINPSVNILNCLTSVMSNIYFTTEFFENHPIMVSDYYTALWKSQHEQFPFNVKDAQLYTLVDKIRTLDLLKVLTSWEKDWWLSSNGKCKCWPMICLFSHLSEVDLFEQKISLPIFVKYSMEHLLMKWRCVESFWTVFTTNTTSWEHINS